MNLRIAMLAMATLLLAACGFHLRRSANLPAGMQRVYLSVSGNSDFRRGLARAMAATGSTVVDEPGPGIAQMRVSQARFDTNALTITGQGRISEYAIRFHVEFNVVSDQGKILVPPQQIDMSREFTYDASQAIGRQTQIEAIRDSMIQDMVRSVMFRLQAVAEYPAPATSSPMPAPAASSSMPASASTAG